MYMIKDSALANGNPEIRVIITSRSGTAKEQVELIWDKVVPALIDPLTEKETQVYTYTPANERIIFEGTVDKAEEFFDSSFRVTAGMVHEYHDGLPIVLPTEDRVKEMLKGTSHKPDELLTLKYPRVVMNSMNQWIEREKGWPVEFSPMNWTATVERVAVNAVMAGCKPEYLPVVLAIAESGCPTRTTTFWGMWQVVSGPIALEIGMNSGIGAFDPGNHANATIGRAMELMAINLGGAKAGFNRMNAIGNPINLGGACIAEAIDKLPDGWKGLNEEAGFGAEDSVVLCAYTPRGIIGNQFSPSSYRALQNNGTGGMAERLGVTGKPGPHNWLRYLMPGIYANTFNSAHIFMTPRMAMDLYDYGFKTKEDVYKWWWENSFVPMSEYKKQGWYDFRTNGGENIETTSGKKYKDLPDEYMIPLSGERPMDNMIIVVGGEEEMSLQMLGDPMRSNIFHIDPWR
ncbi:MAG: hypothetical protein ACOX8P_04275 [Tepidanaerobacteraceae bacterium]|jgi:hypothetical protein